MLKQSKELPIVLKGIRFMEDASPEAKKLVTRNLHRVRSLGITFESCSRMDVAGWIEKVLALDAAPILKDLNLAITGANHRDTVMMPDATIALSSLTVKGFCPVFPKSRMQEKITSFRIKHLWTMRSTAYRTYLRTTLSLMPNLTYLFISFMSFPFPFTPESGARALLPQLEMLCFSGTVWDCLFSLDALQFPPTARLDLRIQNNKSYSVNPLYTALARIFRDREDVRSEAATTTYDVHYLTKLHNRCPHRVAHRVLVFDSLPGSPSRTNPSSATLSENSAPEPDRPPILLLQSSYGNWMSNTGDKADPRWLSQIVNILNIPTRCSVTSLHMHSNVLYDVDSVVFSNNFDSNRALLPKLGFLACAGITSLYIGDLGTTECVAPFLRLRKAPNSDAAAESGSTTTDKSKREEFLAFPNLESLFLGDLSPSASMSIEGGTNMEKATLRTSRVIQDLQSALEYRAQTGRRLKTLEMEARETATAWKSWIKTAQNMGWVEDIISRSGESQNDVHRTSSLDDMTVDMEDEVN